MTDTLLDWGACSTVPTSGQAHTCADQELAPELQNRGDGNVAEKTISAVTVDGQSENKTGRIEERPVVKR